MFPQVLLDMTVCTLQATQRNLIGLVLHARS